MSMEERQRTRLASVGLLVLFFVTGALSGVALDRALGPGTPVAGDVGPAEPEGEEEREEERREPMYRQVGPLTGEQEARIAEVVERYRADRKELRDDFEAEFEPRYDSLRREVWERYESRYHAMIQQVREGIKEAMTADQRARYDSLIADYERRMEERRRAHESTADTTTR